MPNLKCFMKGVLVVIFLVQLGGYAEPTKKLKRHYRYQCNIPSDIRGHLPVLKQLASECSSVAEIGIRDIISTWGILMGLAESAAQERYYLGIDIAFPPLNKLQFAQQLADSNQIHFQFLCKDDMLIELPQVDFLFIDSLHTYAHLTYELEKFSPQVAKYIAMHDTSPPWENRDDTSYQGDYSEYPAHIDRNKRGLWPAVEDFLSSHHEWELFERRLNDHGLTILKRIR